MSYEVALATVLGQARSFGKESVSLSSALGRVLAQDVVAPFGMPRFDNSAVDGYAVSDADIGVLPKTLSVAGIVQAGADSTGFVLEPGVTVQVMTGALLPTATSAVLMQEDVERLGDSITLNVPTIVGRNIRRQASEFRKGDVILSKGTIVSPPSLLAIASLGLSSIDVSRQARIGILVTGDELVEPGQELNTGEIYESNSFAIQSSLTLLGFNSVILRAKDTAVETEEAMASLLETCDVLISLGGVSVGLFDFVRGAICHHGFEILVPKVAVKPGKPFVFGRRNEDGKVVFGLPGNPMSALCTFTLFVWPYLSRSCGQKPQATIECALDTDFANNGDRVELVPATARFEKGQMFVKPLPTPGSHSVSGLVETDCFIVVPILTRLEKNSIVQAVRLPWRSFV